MRKNMKLKFGSLFMIFALVLSVLVLPVRANASTIDLTGDRSEALTVHADGNVILNLNGHTMSGKIINNGTLTINGDGKVAVSNDHVVTNNGTLTINGGTFDALANGKAAVYNNLGATTNIKGGTFLRSLEAGYKDASGNGYNGGNSWYTLFNQGTLNIEGGTFENKGDYSSLLENGWYSGAPAGSVLSELTITGGTFKSGMHTIKNDSYGKLIVSGGSFTATKSGSALLNWNMATISNGTFNSERTNAILSVKDRVGIESGELKVTGGTFNSGFKMACFAHPTGYTFAEPTVTGGSYSAAVGANLAKEYKLVQENGRNVVKAKVPTITLSETKTAVAVGTTKTLTATRVDAIDGDIVWSSDNSSIARVADGVVTPVSTGKTKITATADGASVSCEIQVYVTEEPTLPTPPANNGNETTIKVNDKTSQALVGALNNIIANVDTTTAISAETKDKLKQAMAAGQELSVSAETKKVDAKTVDKADVAKVEKVISKEATIAQYFDLSMMLKAGSSDLGTMNEMSAKASFTITVPKDLVKTGRTFYMVRIHNGVAEKITGTLKGKDFTFETDKFSLYALVYEDTKTVDTGDRTSTTSLFIMMGAASLIFAGLLLKRRQEK